MMERPAEVATLSMRRLAARIGVPSSTMNRLAKALGFGTYDELRALFRDSINQQSPGYSLRDGQVQAIARENKPDHSLDVYQQAAASNINTLFDHIDRAALERAVQALSDARTVLVVGMHAWHSAASHLHHMGITAFGNWHQLVPGGAEFPRLLGALAAGGCRRLHCRRALRCRFHQGRAARPRGRRTGHRHHRSADVAADCVFRRQPAHFGPQPEHFPVPRGRYRPHRSAGGHGRRAERTVGGRERRKTSERSRRDMGEYWTE